MKPQQEANGSKGCMFAKIEFITQKTQPSHPCCADVSAQSSGGFEDEDFGGNIHDTVHTAPVLSNFPLL